jgi:hypothetical protein
LVPIPKLRNQTLAGFPQTVHPRVALLCRRNAKTQQASGAALCFWQCSVDFQQQIDADLVPIWLIEAAIF